MNGITSKFYRYSEGVKLGRYVDDQRDELLIGDYVDGDGCKFEFGVREHHLSQPRPHTVIRVEVFSDSFQAFEFHADFFKWLAGARPLTLDAIQNWLSSNGYTNGLAGIAPKERRS